MVDPTLSDTDRERFDCFVEESIEHLPEQYRLILERIPVVVEDRPSESLLRGMTDESGQPIPPEELCGLYVGPMLTERSVEDPSPESECVFLFRVGIFAVSGGVAGPDDALSEEIRITLLHEIGHHFGLEEDDLDALGYS